MRKIIYHLRKQPEQTRRHILHVLTVVAAVFLLFVWVYSLGKNLTSPNTQVKVNNDLKVFSALKDNLVGGYANIVDPNLNASQ